MARVPFFAAPAPVLAAFLTVGAHAQFQPFPLSDMRSDQGGTRVAGLWGGLPAGSMWTEDGVFHAVIWPRGPEGWIDLNPAGAEAAAVNCSSAGVQAGWALVGGVRHAGLWRGSAATWTDLAPPGTTGSEVLAATADRQAGVANNHACVWSGSAGSFVDLHPAGFDSSRATGAEGDVQVGYADHDGPWPRSPQSFRWRGSAASAENITPPGVAGAEVMGVSGGVYFGSVRYEGEFQLRAAMWWPGGLIDLDGHNPDFDLSGVLAADGGVQVGFYAAPVGGGIPVWFGSPGSMLDIRSLRGSPKATCVWRDGPTVMVGGYADTFPLPWHIATVWTYTIPGSPDFNGDGFLDFFDYGDFIRCFEGDGCPPGRLPDFNLDGSVDPADLQDFTTAFEHGG